MSKTEVVTLKDLEKELAGLEKDLAAAQKAANAEKVQQIEEQINALNASISQLKTSAEIWETEEKQRLEKKKRDAAALAAKKQIQDGQAALQGQKPSDSQVQVVNAFTPIAPVSLFIPESFWCKELDRSVKQGVNIIRTKEEYDIIKKRAVISNLKK